MVKLDVVIPLFNGARWIQEALHSVFGQSFVPDRVIVVDDGSTDGSPDIVRSFPQVSLIRNPSKGPTAARNFGFESTAASLIAFLDQDDVWHKDHLKFLLHVLMSRPDAVAAYSSLRMFRDGEPFSFSLLNQTVEEFDPWETYPTCSLAVSPSLLLVRREAFNRVGRFPTCHGGMGDYSLAMRLSTHYKMVRCCVETVAYRKHPHSHTNMIYADPWHMLRFSQKVNDDLLNYRLPYVADLREKQILRRRSEVNRLTCDLIEYLVKSDWGVFQKTALDLESASAEETFEYRKRLCQHILNVLIVGFSSGNQSEKSCAHFTALLEQWPGGASGLFDAMRHVIVADRPGYRFYLNYFKRKPSQMSRLSLILLAFRNRFVLGAGF